MAGQQPQRGPQRQHPGNQRPINQPGMPPGVAGAVPPSAYGRRSPAPKKNKNKDIIVWTVSIVVSVLCVVIAIWMIGSHSSDLDAANAANRRKATPPETAFSLIRSGQFNDETVQFSDFKQYLDAGTKDVIAAGVAAVRPVKNERLSKPGDFETTYVAKVAERRGEITDGHAYLKSMKDDFERLTSQAKSKDDAELRRCVVDSSEFIAKLLLLQNRANIQNQILQKRMSEKFEKWNRESSKDLSTKSSLKMTNVYEALKEDKTTADYKKWKLFNDIKGHLNDANGTTLEELKTLDLETWERIAPVLPKWSSDTITAFNDATAKYLGDIKAEAQKSYEPDQKAWADYAPPLNKAIDLYVSARTKALESLRGLAAQAGKADNPRIQKMITDYQRETDEVAGWHVAE